MFGGGGEGRVGRDVTSLDDYHGSLSIATPSAFLFYVHFYKFLYFLLP